MPECKPIAAYVYDDAMSEHVLRSDHPMRPVRLHYTFELLKAYNAFSNGTALLVPPRPATEEELLTFHTPGYIEAVRRYSESTPNDDGLRYGFSDTGDNPTYSGMYEVALLSTGASVRAAELVADGQVRTAFSPAGGLHHAAAGHASGFCVFDDPVVAINALRKRGLRVAYVDVDAHHGDGVQNAFYADDDVLTISLHESGQYLFPGTGELDELGRDKGRGFAVNLPLFPYTTDDVYLEAFDAVVPPLLQAFKPDVLATQLGIDSYATDPLTHLALTTSGFMDLVRRFAAQGYPWLAFGGGGYDLDAVARCWTLAYGIMLGQEWPDEIPESARSFLHADRLRSQPTLPREVAAAQDEARRFAHGCVEALRRVVFPLHGASG